MLGSGEKKILSLDFARSNWPGIAAFVFFLAGFPLFKQWQWVFFLPVFLFLLFKLKHEWWPAYLTAALYTLCFPHAGLGFLAFICLAPVLVLAMDAERAKTAMFFGFLAGFLGSLGKVYWIVYPITYFSPIPFAVGILVTTVVCLCLGAFWSWNFGVLHWAVKKGRLPLWLVFPLGWIFWDFWLTWFLTGFPWDLLGNAAYHIPYFNQTFDLFGSLSVGLVFALSNVMFAELWWYRRGRRTTLPRRLITAVVVIVLAGFAYGVIRSGQIENRMKEGTAVKVGFVQGNVDQNRKWKPEYRSWIFDNFGKLARRVKAEGAELIIFPETSIPVRQRRWRPLNERVRHYAVENNAWVLTGVPTSGKRLNRDDPRGQYTSHNSAVLVNPAGIDVQWYDKNRLVLFSEYIPFKHHFQAGLDFFTNLLGLPRKRIAGTLNFETGGYYAMMPYPKAPFSVFICYEAVYPEVVRRQNALGAKFLVTITNDAWFGPTSAPYQHWAQVGIRAIENRRWVARAANTGISGIIDPLGRTVQKTGLYVEAAPVGTVYAMDTVSLYQRTGNLFPYLCIVIYLGLLIFVVARRLRDRKEK
ncbi:MAG: apolipoprotein N-acyltransferase [Candidatus Lernaella stagnicola]|nr:apolipoprotein N-acyltransferase [Candidatus Lernaella stagnicola]